MSGRHNFKKSRAKTRWSCFRTIIAWLLVVSALMSTTYAWLENNLYNSLYTGSYITVSADGLILEENGKTTDKVTLEDFGAQLTECASPDGRNFYFPLSNFDEQDNPVFRRSDANDRNSKYISVEFTLTSDKDTDVWLSNESYIIGRAANAVRVSIDFDDQTSDALILDASEYESTMTQMGKANAYGNSAEDEEIVQESRSYYNYFYAQTVDSGTENSSTETRLAEPGKKLFTLGAAEKRKITVNVWLEGWDSDCVSVCRNNCKDEAHCYCIPYNAEDLQINLKLTVGIRDSKVISFCDTSVETWTCIKDLFNYDDFWQIDIRRVFLYDREANILYAMNRKENAETTDGVEKRFYEWYATVPKTLKKVEFVRINYRDGLGYPNEDVWEFWDAGLIVGSDNATHSRFYALGGGNTGRGSSNAGRWDPDLSVITIYFMDLAGADVRDVELEFSVQCNYYGSESVKLTMQMTHIGEMSNSKLYAARVPAKAHSFKFNIEDGTTYAAGDRSNQYNVFRVSNLRWTYNASMLPMN